MLGDLRQRACDLAATAMSRAAGGFRLPPALAFAEVPATTRDLSLDTRHGSVGCTWYAGAPGAGVHVNLHGGGYVVRAPQQDDGLCRYLAHRTGLHVLNVDYDTAPGARFPVAIEQALDVLSWAGRTTELWDGHRISVGGQSAGGALATAVARRARDEGGPHLLGQVLHYPPLDLTRPARDKPSPRGSRAVVKPWMSIVFDTAYVPDRARRSNPFVSPAHRPDPSDLVGVAPALVLTAAEDRLRQEAVDYAQALDAAGALIAWHDVPGVDHGYSIADATAGAATRASYELIAQTLRTRHETL